MKTTEKRFWELLCKYCNSTNVEKRGLVETCDTIKQRIVCHECHQWSRIELDIAVESQHFRTEDELKGMTSSNYYIVTSAQNNTGIDRKFWKAIKKYAEYLDAQILVIPILYLPAGFAKRHDDVYWPSELNPYLVDNEVRLCLSLRVMGNVKITATAVNPLSGFESLTQGDSALFGHAQIQMKTVATPQNRLPKILQTTGSVSEKNYSKAKAGIKGDFHHSLGAVIVEIDEGVPHIRGIVGDERSEFYDLNLHITARGVKKCNEVEALVIGDEHALWIDEDVKLATFTVDDSLVNLLRPKFVVRHDLIDSYSVSHWHRNSPSIKYKKHINGEDSLWFELSQTSTYLEETSQNFFTNVIISSNHHDHIKRWLEEVDWRTEPWNSVVYHELWGAWLQAIDNQEEFHPFIYWMKAYCPVEAMYLTPDYPFIVKGIYLGYHGNRGSNGSKGSLAGFAKIGAKTIIGHTHSPGIEKGAYMIGCSCVLGLDYTSGPSSWMHTHCVVHPNGKRQLIHVIDGYFRRRV
jgi:hypothetical protein